MELDTCPAHLGLPRGYLKNASQLLEGVVQVLDGNALC